MTKTLTTKALRALRDSLKSWQDGYDPVDDKEQYEMFVTAETAVGELLANREAQPVAEVLSSRSGNDTSTIDKALPAGTNLYTAPPAPAVPEEQAWDELCLKNPEMTIGDAIIRAASWNACRAAMLAQPVSQGCELPDNVREALTLALQAMEFMGDTLNNIDAVCTEDVEYVTPAFTAVRGLLAAAPGGGNDA
ncbi:hypothetical protein [Serratia proteamaculans]|uniref:hypothetical protein n=1 Tax=Serratia proteamaculans TaxID=28151 RepID=UPI002177AFEE|nr:hypothetical protein [Serratia proteamaculans]CAI1024747.1 Uncharacterised protein [Serratia proteamaculans]CAI1035190.1 Uncharacterised protein [Serratia proteamaculans]